MPKCYYHITFIQFQKFVDESMIPYQATFFKAMDAQFMGSCIYTVTAGLHLHGFIAIAPLDSCASQKKRKRKGRNRKKK